MKTVQDLRAEGCKVRVHHIRRFDKNGQLLPRGGMTIIEIDTPDGKHYEGKAKCSTKDAYCKRMGRVIAIGRALCSGKNRHECCPENHYA